MKGLEAAMQEIRGPLAPTTGGLIYQVNLGLGFIATNPSGFGRDQPVVPEGWTPVESPREEEPGGLAPLTAA
jgi:hypothetical protein